MPEIGKTLMRLPRDYAKGEVIEVKTMIIHPNHNGRRQSPEGGGYIAAYYVRSIDVYYGEVRVTSVRASAGLSQNPYFTFHLKADRSAPLRVEWEDSKGQRFSHTVEVRV
jgi:sulfur-oxidizing protein SoxZ